MENTKSKNVELDLPSASKNVDVDDLWDEDGSSWADGNEELNRSSDLHREWQRRHDQFHTIGYRDGLMAGKEAAAQEGFNIGFKDSVLVGHNWGLVRGVTSALACLPDGMKERLIETEKKRNKFQHLYESVHSLSTTDALKLFHGELPNISGEQRENVEHNPLRIYYEELQQLLRESHTIEVRSHLD